VQEVVKVPVFANGDIWSVEDWRRCREISGVEDIMLGRGLVSRPDLARQIAAARAGEEVVEMSWAQMQPMLQEFWTQSVAQLTERQAPGRLKQWLAMLTRNYPEAVELFTAMRRETDLQQVSRLLGMAHPEAALPSVGASLLAKDVNDNAGILI
jgi:tRNA-dihydrouridine synthase C